MSGHSFDEKITQRLNEYRESVQRDRARNGQPPWPTPREIERDRRHEQQLEQHKVFRHAIAQLMRADARHIAPRIPPETADTHFAPTPVKVSRIPLLRARQIPEIPVWMISAHYDDTTRWYEGYRRPEGQLDVYSGLALDGDGTVWNFTSETPSQSLKLDKQPTCDSYGYTQAHRAQLLRHFRDEPGHPGRRAIHPATDDELLRDTKIAALDEHEGATALEDLPAIEQWRQSLLGLIAIRDHDR